MREVDLHIAEGDLALVVGRTGAGKSTLLGAVNGLVPHFSGGTLSGRVTVAGLSTADHPPRELARVVGVVGQDPLAGFVTDSVEDELAFGMEQLAVPPQTMRTRVEEMLDVLGIAELRGRSLRSLSGGQQQRVAIGSVLAAGPRILVLDEPTSALDPTSAEEVLATLLRLVHDLGVTVLIAEHRLERVVEYADLLVTVGVDGRVAAGSPAEMMAGLLAGPGAVPLVPPVVRLGGIAGWSPLPLSVRAARRAAGPLRERLADSDPAAFPAGPAGPAAPAGTVPAPAELLRASGVVVAYGTTVAVSGVDLALAAGEVAALMGRNGSGKSSLLWALSGAGRRRAGRVAVRGADPAAVGPRQARALVGLVPQTPADLLYLETVGAECAEADRESGAAAGDCAALLAALVPGIDPAQHPRDLSEGQRLALVLAVQLSARPAVLLLDEPTRGLDYPAKAALTVVLAELAAAGTAVLVATHDVEFVARTAHRVVVMAGGEIVADGPTVEVVHASPMFAPQVAKVLAPQRWLTTDQVGAALAGRR
nr:ABC transporter ATP-binding protein [Nakamurella flavida]